MSKASLLGITLELPAGWRGVQAVFLAPENDGPKAAGLLTMAKQASFRDNLAFHIGPSGATKPAEYLNALLQTLDPSGIKKEPEVQGDSAIAEVLNEAPGGARIRQLIHAQSRNGDEMWVLTYSFLEGQGDVKEKRAFLRQVLASMKSAPVVL